MENCSGICDLLNLPDEIWSKVFTYLPLVDRQCVRLTCHRFYNACNTFSIQRNEEFIFRSFDNEVLSLQPFLNIDRKVWNIRIERSRIIDASVCDFFEKWGARIYSLALVNCEFSPGLLQSMIELCRSLRQIIFDYTWVAEEFLKIFFDDFVALCNGKIVCSTVWDFTLKLSWKTSPYLSNLKFVRFFSVFPNVRNLSLAVSFREYFEEKSADSTSDTEFSFLCVYNQLLKMSNQLEKLAVCFKSIELVNWPNLIQAMSKVTGIEMKNLKKLFINWYSHLETENLSLVNPNKFSCLTHILCEIDNVFLSDFIVLLLATAKELRVLFIRGPVLCPCTHDRTINASAFVALTQSKLVTFYFHHGPPSFVRSLPSDLENNPLSPNYTLANLSVGTGRHDMWELLIKYFRNLCHLNLGRINCNVLKNICEWQKNLRILKVRHRHSIDGKLDPTPLDCSKMRQWLEMECLPSNRTLPSLTHLVIIEDTASAELTEFMVNELVFPKLESLTLSTSASSLAGACYSSWELICKLPQLQQVHLVLPFAASFQQWLSSVCALPKLRILRVEESAPSSLTQSQYHQLFEVCSSLLTVYHNDAVYYMNYSANTVCKSTSPKPFVNEVCHLCHSHLNYFDSLIAPL